MTSITVQAVVNAPVETVWKKWTTPSDIMNWNNASDDWHTPRANNDLRMGGSFLCRMESKDGTMGFDFTGVYTDIKTNELIRYTMDDNRTVKITFTKTGNNSTQVEETFDAETENSLDMQRQGWQAILDNFKRYVETTT